MDVSVVIPTYNRASLLIKLLDAWREVDHITKYEYELIFSDDGSPDDTIATLKQQSKGLPIVILENQHGGAGHARNAAIRRARGERILMLGDDIFPDAELINRHIEISRKFGPETAILGHIKWHPELKLNYLMTHITEVGHEQFSLDAFQPGQYVDFRHFYTSNISVDRKFLSIEAILFDERFSKANFEDTELGYRLAKRGAKIRFEPAAWAYHYHAYTADGFCKRQKIAGEMAVILVAAHPELENLFGVDRTWKIYSEFRNSRLAKLPIAADSRIDFDAIIKSCEAYEHELPLATAPQQKYIKLALSSLYLRLFRSFFELGILTKLEPARTDYNEYLRTVYFNPDGFWNLYLEATNAFKDLSEPDRALREMILLSYADQTHAGVQIALTNKEVELLRTREERTQAERECAIAREELDRIKASSAWRIGQTLAHPGKVFRNLNRKLVSIPPETDAKSVTRTTEPELPVATDEGRVLGPRLGIIVSEHNLPSAEERGAFFSEFGNEHCFILRAHEDEFHVFSTGTEFKMNFEALPIDYLYQPENWDQRLSSNHFRNVLLCLAHVDLDFVIVSPTLARLPQLALSASAKNQIVFSKRLGLSFPENGERQAKGRVLRLLPAEFPVSEAPIEEVFHHQEINYAPDIGRYTPDEGYLFIGQQSEGMSDSSASELRVTHFIPKFRKEKPLVFVLPMTMAIGGVERNAIEVMKQLQDRYHFVVITMDRHDKSRGSLHHQLNGLTVAVYDLMELGNLHYTLAFLNDLKQVYAPDAMWICNGMLWLCDHAEHVRKIFHDVPIIDNQAWDAEVGWSEFYHQPGIQSFDRFIATNSHVYRKFVDDLKMNPDRIDSIYPCFDSKVFSAPSPLDQQKAFIREFNLPEDRPVFLFCGRLHEQKGPFDFLELARRRLQKHDDAFFVMRGTGDLAPEVDNFIHDNRLTNLRRLSFVEDTVPLLSIAAGLIITSHYETITIVLLEALAMGLPVLSTDVGDIRPVIEEYQAGLVVSEIADPDALEAAYENWRKNLERYAANARQCNAEIRARFSCETIAKQYSASWQKAIREFTIRN
jgi:glycosyltransferase involved in cell wall biosynthesis